jgi:hypothetical protein
MRGIALLCLVSILLTARASVGQYDPTIEEGRGTRWGVELDPLPYVYGGWYLGAWLGYDQVRLRLVRAEAEIPDFLVDDPFADQEVRAFALLGDWFFHEGFVGPWLSGGLEIWDGTIGLQDSPFSKEYDNIMLTLGAGYAWPIWRGLHLDPWIALHVKIAGDDEVVVDRQTFEPQTLLPEGSIKLGWSF